MKRLNRLTSAALVAAVALIGCADLDVTNPNDPDTEKVLRTSADVEALIGSSALTWWTANMIRYPTMALSTMASQTGSRWADWGMQAYSVEPRIAINNDVGADFNALLQSPWFGNYRANKAANDGLQAIDQRGIELGEDGEDTPRGRAFAKLIQGLSHGMIALLYDRGFVVDESVDIEAELELVPHEVVLEQAVTSLEEAIAIAESNDFTTPSVGWFHGIALTDEELVRVAHSFIARFLASSARTPAERAAVDWEQVIYHAERGVEDDFGPLRDGGSWWGGHYNTPPGSHRAHLRFLGPADQSGAYQAWEASDPAQRSPFLIDTDDQRVTGGTPTSDGEYVQYMESSLVPDERGVWHQSNYYYNVREPTRLGGVGAQMVTLTVRELRLLIAEGLYRLGEEDDAAEIINETRVANGGLPAVTPAGTSGDRCVPRRRDGSCGDLFDALKWEKNIETAQTGTGGMFFDKRGWGDLYPGTPLQFPVPAVELTEMELPIYTFGGGGEYSAPAWD